MIEEGLPSRNDVKKNQIKLLAVAEGFIPTSILLALLRLGIFECIGKGTSHLSEIAKTLGTPPEPLGRLLNAGVVIKVLESTDGMNFRLTPASAHVLRRDAGESYIGDWIVNTAMFRSALSKLAAAVLKGGPVVEPRTELGGNEETTRDFMLAMHNYATLLGKELAQCLDLSSSRSLLDLGCGSGTYSFQLGIRYPNLALHLADLPGVLSVAAEIEHTYPLQNSVYYHPLDVTKDEIHGTYDVVLVSNMLHMVGADASRSLLKRLYRSIEPGGSIIVQARFLREDRLGPLRAIMLDLNQFCTTDVGRNHSVAETTEWLREAGFRDIEYRRMSLLNKNSYLRGYRL